jgi:hypothetical protein
MAIHTFLKKGVQKFKKGKLLKDDEFIKYQEIEYYSNTVQAWYTTRMEKDKSILTLSSGAIGLLATFLNVYGIETQLQTILYVVAMVSFLIAIISSLWIFTQNSHHLENIIQDKNCTNDTTLEFLDKILNGSFIIGIIFTILISIISVPNQKKDNHMAEQKPTINKSETKQIEKGSISKNDIGSSSHSLNGASNLKPLNESFNGVSNMKPVSNNDTQDKSLNGASKIKPATPEPKIDDSKK